MQLSPINDKGTMAIIGRKKSCWQIDVPKNTLRMDRLDFQMVVLFNLLIAVIIAINLRTHVDWATAYFGKSTIAGNHAWRNSRR